MTMQNLTDLTARILGMDEASQLDASLQALILQNLNTGITLACLERYLPVHREQVTLDSQGRCSESSLTKNVSRIQSVLQSNEPLPFAHLWEDGILYLSVPNHSGEAVTVCYEYMPDPLIASETPPLPGWFHPFLADYAAMRLLAHGDATQQGRIDYHREHWYEGLFLLRPPCRRAHRFHCY